jgi:serine protease Do
VDPREDGLFVVHVDDRSPADRAGFRVGDKILRWEDRAVPNANVWNDLLSKAEPGDRVVVTVERDGRERRLRVQLGRT